MTDIDWKDLEDRLRGFFYVRGVDHSDIDDLIQDTFYRYLVIYKDETVITTEAALINIAKYIFKEYCYHIKRKIDKFVSIDRLPEGKEILISWPFEGIDYEEEYARQSRKLKRLIQNQYSARNRDIIRSFMLKGVPQKVLAEKYNMSVAAVQMVINRFRKKLHNVV